LQLEPSSESEVAQSLQGYLAHKKSPLPQDNHRTLGTVLARVPGGEVFLMSEVTLSLYRITSLIRNNPSLGPYDRPMSRALW